MAQTLAAKVKNVLSGDTVVLVPTKTAQFPVPERTLTLQYVRGDSFLAKEFLRQLVIGKEVKFEVLFKMPTTGKEFGDIKAPIFSSLIEYLLEHGMVKLKDNIRVEDESNVEFVENLKKLEQQAQTKKLGIWDAKFQEPDVVPLSEDIEASSQKSPLNTIVEKVISGDRIIGRILVNKNKHVSQPLLLAGIKTPRTDDPSATVVKVAQQAKQFVEDRLLSTKSNIKVKVIGHNQAGLPLVIVEHPSGNNIHEKLLENGFAEVVDWQSSLIGSSIMSGLRKAEQTAKALGKGQFASVSVAQPSAGGASSSKISSKTLRPGVTVDSVTITKVINADTFNVRLPNAEEITVQLASLRAPRPNDSTVTSNSSQQQALVQMAREFSRNLAIGKSASMYIDGFRGANEELGLDSRFLVSLKINNKDVSEQIVSHGYATVIKHNKQTSGERSMNWDRLVELEEEQKKLGKKGVYFNGGDISKILTIDSRVVNASENVQKAKTFFNGFQKKGRISGFYVEFVSGVNRVKLYNPREGTKLTLILGGLTNSKAQETGADGLEYMNKKYLQRNVEFDIYDTDKIGGFIGNLYANAQALKPVQIELLSNGLASVHGLAVSSNKYGAELEKAEDAAKAAHKGIWKDYDEEKAQNEANAASEKLQQLNLEAAKPKFFNIEVVDISPSQILSYHLIDADTSAKFTQFKKEFNDFHSQNASASANSADSPINLTKGPRKNEIVSAKFTENGKYYRAKVLNFDRSSNKYEVKHVDFGNIDKVGLSDLRALPKKYSTDLIKPFAHTLKLQNITLPPTQPNDYLTEAIYVLEDLTFDKKLVLSGLPSTSPGVEYDGILYDAEKSLQDSSYTLNKQLVSEGYGIVDTRAPSHLKNYVDELVATEKKAKSERLGCWELGDITQGDDDF
ncbi:hypothetical protein FT663_01619 [Candidozyma haemuli var. vulneris]|uniref:Uncharacterized protein n=1 Tax=Candidozyma haemuli TaxID=45357 RepID=A0A2V1B0J4_9ASCO|nr:hypothetical protein CXQ85_004121 [[Candida] haemuloni]KAF3994119.1 hypothetical protein FT663_01619 [[Candida] haemuloni var. vulneris]KAF3994285.1 hypothetical protein FT662_00154 [[Candida] haemuloni var. vulneris]PVH23827.1 hypothetical protein CXQ85_004121 [[Candida] haemuloni]